MEHALTYNILITPLLMIDLTYSIYVTVTALSIGLACVIFELKFVVNPQDILFEDIMLKYFSSWACEISSVWGCTVFNAARSLHILTVISVDFVWAYYIIVEISRGCCR